MDNFEIFNNKNGVNFFNNLKGGVKANAFKTETDKKLLSIFDKNHDGILSKAELSQIADDLDNIKKDGKISQKELNNFINANDLGAEGKEALMNFIGTIANEDANIVSSETINGQTVTTYKDGTTEAVNQDGSKTVTQKDSSGNTVVTEMTKDGVPTKKTTTSPDGNKETVVEYNSDGRTVKSETTIDKQAQTKTVKEGTTVTQYDTCSGQDVKSKVIENAGIPGKEKTTTFEKNEDGQQIETTTDGNQTKVIVKDSSGRVIKGSIEDLNKGIRKEVEYTSEGKTETITQDGRTVTNEYNKDGQKIASEINGQKAKYDGQGNTLVVVQNNEPIYTLAQKFGVSMDDIAQANGGRRNFKTGEEIKIPKEVAPGSKGLVGRKSAEEAKAETNAIYKKITDGAKEFDSMNSMKMKSEVSSYKELALELFKQEGNPKPSDIQLQARIKNLQAANPGIKDGDLKGKELNVKVADNNPGLKSQNAVEMFNMAVDEAIAKDDAAKLEQSMSGLGTDEKAFIKTWNKINKDNVADILLQYRVNSKDKEGLISAMSGEFELNDKTQMNFHALQLLGRLYAKADELGIDYSDIDSQLSVKLASDDPKKFDDLALQLASKIKMTEEFKASGGNIKNEEEFINNSVNTLMQNGMKASENLTAQVNKDGIFGAIADKAGHVTDLINGNGNYIEKVTEDSQQYMAKCLALQGAAAESPEKFKEVFRQEFGTDYNPAIIQKYNMTMEKRGAIDAQQYIIQDLKKNFGGINAMQGAIAHMPNNPAYYSATNSFIVTNQLEGMKAGAKGNYENAYKKLKEYHEAVYGPEQGILEFNKLTLSEAGTVEDFEKMEKIANEMIGQAEKELHNLTGGISYDAYVAKCSTECKAAYGTGADIVGRVENYCASQEKGASYIKNGIKAYIGIGVALATGGTGLAGGFAVEALVDGEVNAGIELLDKATSNNGVTGEDVEKILKESAEITYSEFVGGAATSFAGFNTKKIIGRTLDTGVDVVATNLNNMSIGKGADDFETNNINFWAKFVTKNNGAQNALSNAGNAVFNETKEVATPKEDDISKKDMKDAERNTLPKEEFIRKLNNSP